MLSEKIANASIDLAIKYAPMYPNFYIVDGKPFLPHITIFTASQKIEDIEAHSTAIEKFIKKLNPIRLDIVKFDAYDDGTLCLKINPSGELLSLREKTRDFVEEKISGILRKKASYNPHITLTKYRNPKDCKMLVETLGLISGSFISPAIGIGQCDDLGTPLDGQIREILFEFSINRD